MPKIQWENLPRKKWAHLRDRARERKLAMDDLLELANWKSQDPDVPDGDWYNDFGTFKLCGTGRFPNTFLTSRSRSRINMTLGCSAPATTGQPPRFIQRGGPPHHCVL